MVQTFGLNGMLQARGSSGLRGAGGWWRVDRVSFTADLNVIDCRMNEDQSRWAVSPNAVATDVNCPCAGGVQTYRYGAFPRFRRRQSQPERCPVSRSGLSGVKE